MSRPLLTGRRASLTGDPSTPRTRDWASIALVLVVVVGIGLRFVSRGPMWLDEAQSVSIASVPVHDLGQALRHDGSPPLWYVLLHGWMWLFGSSPVAARAMSAIPGVLSLAAVYLLGRRVGGRQVARLSLVLLAVLPFAVRYSVEARMYSLVLLLGLVAAHAVLSVHRASSWWPVLGLTAAVSALLYTHYFAIWACAALFLAELYLLVVRRERAAVRVMTAVVVGVLTLVPWLPVLLFQLRHTGAPWGSAPSANAVLDSLQYVVGGGSPAGRIVDLAVLLLLCLAVAGRAVGEHVVLARPFARTPSRLLALVALAVVLGVADDMVGDQAYAPRYSAAVVGLLVVVIAFGVLALPTRRARRVVVVGLVVAWIGMAAAQVIGLRTQAGQVAAALNARARPGDVVVYCPDQLGPSTSRLVRVAGLRQVVYPSFAGPGRVDWVDYEPRVSADVVVPFSSQLLSMATGHAIWVVSLPGSEPLQGRCEDLLNALSAARDRLPVHVIKRDVHRAENMNLDVFAGPASG